MKRETERLSSGTSCRAKRQRSLCFVHRTHLISNFLIVCGWFATGAISLALDPHVAISQYAEDVWLKRDGLPANAVKEITQTADGYIWLGTAGGLIRFDGARFAQIPTNPTEPSQREPVSAVLGSPNGDFWVGISFGGVRQIRDGTPKILNIGDADPSILRLHLDHEGTLRIGTPLGLYRYSETGKIELAKTKTAYISGIAEDPTGKLWVCTHGDIEYFDGKEWKIAALEPAAESIFADSRGNIWVACPNKLLRYTPKGLQAYGLESGLLGNRVTAINEDHDGNVWVGTTEGLNRLRFDANGAMQIDHLALPNVLAITEDREGSLWIGTESGLHRLKNANLTLWTVREGLLGNFAPSMNGGPDGSIYIFSKGAPNGAVLLRDGKITPFPATNDGPSYVARDGSLWVSSNGMLTRLKDGVVTIFTEKQGLPTKWIAAITEDDQSLILCLSTMSGIRRWSPTTGASPYRLKDGSAFTVPYHITYAHRQADGTIWMGGYDGLWRVKNGDITRYTTQSGMESKKDWYDANPQSTQNFRTVIAPGMADDWVSSIAESADGTLWIASPRGGLTRMKDGNFHAFSVKDGLVSNQLFSVLTDSLDNVWLGTPFGIYRAGIKDLEARAEGQTTVIRGTLFNSSDGMKVDECVNEYQPAAWKGTDGKLWFGTHEGAVSIDPTHLRTNELAPNVLIENFVVDEKDRSRSAAVVIPPGSKKFEFHYTALSFLNPERVKFKYKLDGYDQAWVTGDDRRVAYYTGLPPGDYRFNVIACNNDGVWNNTGASLAFVVQPLFFQTGWFYFIAALATIACILGAHRLHVRRLYAREKELQSRVTQRTVELSKSNEDLRKEVTEREKAEQEVERVHQQLLTASHRAGMAEVASGVLHNVGNVLNSVNVSTSVIVDTLHLSKVANLSRVAKLLQEHKTNLGAFITADPKGMQLPVYITGLATQLNEEHSRLLSEAEGLRSNVEHIKDIVAMQQSYAGASGLAELLDVTELFEEALRLSNASSRFQGIKLAKNYPAVPIKTKVERHKALQILINLIQNAYQACDESVPSEKQVTLQVRRNEKGVELAVIDSGVGIPEENLARIFQHGFTTKKDGHGFGLHSSVLSARSMGGDLCARSEGPGKGSEFIFTLPAQLDAV